MRAGNLFVGQALEELLTRTHGRQHARRRARPVVRRASPFAPSPGVGPLVSGAELALEPEADFFRGGGTMMPPRGAPGLTISPCDGSSLSICFSFRI